VYKVCIGWNSKEVIESTCVVQQLKKNHVQCKYNFYLGFQSLGEQRFLKKIPESQSCYSM